VDKARLFAPSSTEPQKVHDAIAYAPYEFFFSSISVSVNADLIINKHR